jgi:hypothetical protein
MLGNQLPHPEPTDFIDVLFLKSLVNGQFLPIKRFVLEGFDRSC